MTKLDIEDNSMCRYDNLTFYDGTIDHNKLHYIFCGIQHPAFMFHSSSDKTTVVFQSDQSKSWTGFNFMLEVVPNNIQGKQKISANLGKLCKLKMPFQGS